MNLLEKALNELSMEVQCFEHPPVYTVEDVKQLEMNIPGTKTKNLFLRDKKGKQHYLVVVPDEKQVDLKSLAPVLDSDKLSFGSPDRLKKHLGIEPGSVSLLAVVNDTEKNVALFVDEALKGAEQIQSHPLVNTRTMVLSMQDMLRFAEKCGHPVQWVDVPARN